MSLSMSRPFFVFLKMSLSSFCLFQTTPSSLCLLSLLIRTCLIFMFFYVIFVCLLKKALFYFCLFMSFVFVLSLLLNSCLRVHVLFSCLSKCPIHFLHLKCPCLLFVSLNNFIFIVSFVLFCLYRNCLLFVSLYMYISLFCLPKCLLSFCLNVLVSFLYFLICPLSFSVCLTHFSLCFHAVLVSSLSSVLFLVSVFESVTLNVAAESRSHSALTLKKKKNLV